jgi:hypothetical protein
MVVELELESRYWQDILLYFTSSRPGLWAHPPSYIMDTVFLLPGVKRQRREADLSLVSTAEVKHGEAITPLPHISSWSDV